MHFLFDVTFSNSVFKAYIDGACGIMRLGGLTGTGPFFICGTAQVKVQFLCRPQTKLEPGNFQVQRPIAQHVIVTSQAAVIFLFSYNEIGDCGRVQNVTGILYKVFAVSRWMYEVAAFRS
jgi:hypothetical protein